MGVQVHRLVSDSHHKNILASLHQLRTQGQLCDVTVQVDYQGDVLEFQAHQVILAASSGYFRSILSSQDAIKDKLVLSDMQSSDFSLFLEFVYTGAVEVAKDKIGDVQAVAQLLDCKSLSEVCGEALSGGALQKPGGRTCASKLKPQAASGSLSPQGAEKEEILQKRLKVKSIQRNVRLRGKKLKLKLAGRKMVQRHWYCSSREKNGENQVGDDGGEECGNGTEDGARPESRKDETEEASPVGPSSDGDEWVGEEEVHSIDPRDPLFLLESFASKEYLKHHSNIHTGSKPYKCDKCDRGFAQRNSLNHKSCSSGERPYKCKDCDKQFTQINALQRHQRIHTGEKPFMCVLCKRAFSDKSTLRRGSIKTRRGGVPD
uniref:GDNF-inducible zinc finger protein 1-like n=1 Tax=Kryptolebias marmoratus TaxID=37003 RepID=A0A3Q2ZUB8_KRYMA